MLIASFLGNDAVDVISPTVQNQCLRLVVTEQRLHIRFTPAGGPEARPKDYVPERSRYAEIAAFVMMVKHVVAPQTVEPTAVG